MGPIYICCCSRGETERFGSVSSSFLDVPPSKAEFFPPYLKSDRSPSAFCAFPQTTSSRPRSPRTYPSPLLVHLLFTLRRDRLFCTHLDHPPFNVPPLSSSYNPPIPPPPVFLTSCFVVCKSSFLPLFFGPWTLLYRSPQSCSSSVGTYKSLGSFYYYSSATL